VFVACIQGAPGRYEAIRAATRAGGDISPPHLLVAAAEGMATALSLGHIFGVSNERQLSKSSAYGEGCVFDYDGFWRALSGVRCAGWYRFDVPIGHKPLSHAPIEHRRRTKRKRRLKQAVSDHVAEIVKNRYAQPRDAAANTQHPAEPRSWLRLQASPAGPH
jgi:uncharacterized protein VirK/YbjX